MTSKDPTEDIRRAMVSGINAVEGSREYLTEKHGVVYDTKELRNSFKVTAFLAPFVEVQRLSDGVSGTLMFQHHPRYYFGFEEDK